MGDKVELVESDAGVWQMVNDTFDEGVGHADADRADFAQASPCVRPSVWRSGRWWWRHALGGKQNTTLRSGASAAMVR
jgi:hypothetical protein